MQPTPHRFPWQRPRARRDVYRLVLALLAILAGAAAAGVPAAMRAAPAREPLSPALLRKAQAAGSVPVIVSLNTPFEPEGKLGNPNARRAQRERIGRAQRNVERRHPGRANRKVKRFRFIPALALEVEAAALPALAADPEVASVQEDRLSAPELAETNGYTGASAAWTAGATGAGQAVAILDTGVDTSHAFFAGRVVFEACYSSTGASSSYTYTSLCPNGTDSQVGSGAGVNCPLGVSGCDHGTHVAGIAAGRGASASGVARDANLLAFQVFSLFTGSICGSSPSPCALTWDSDQIQALEQIYAVGGSYNVAAVNMSIGSGAYSSIAQCDAVFASTKRAVDNLRSVGIATVISSGNNGYSNAMGGPGCISTAVSVGSTTKPSAGGEQVSYFSNSATWLSLLAPGSGITSSVPSSSGNLNPFASKSGTSMAAPHVAGAWAVLKSRAPLASVDAVLNALQSTGAPVLDTSNGLVKPRIQIDQALAALAPAPTETPVPPTPTPTPTETPVPTIPPTPTTPPDEGPMRIYLPGIF